MTQGREYQPFNFGHFSQDDLTRVVRELGERKYGKLEVRDEDVKVCTAIGQQFLTFLRGAFQSLGLLDRVGIAHPRILISHNTEEGDTAERLLRRGWNARASDWAVVESPMNYTLTIETLLEFLQTNPHRRRERFLSLGSGPGLYETFIGALFAQMPEAREIRIFSVDYAEEMTRIHKRLLSHICLADGRPLTNVTPITGDMTDLKFENGSVDQIICNNALQWVPDWRKALAEMARVMRPKGLGWLYLFVHTHPMCVFRDDGTPLLKCGDFKVPELLDALEAHRFQVHRLRQIAGPQGTGQLGLPISRMFILAKFEARGEIRSWREQQVSASLRGYQTGGERKTFR